jgi:hypothetical protein
MRCYSKNEMLNVGVLNSALEKRGGVGKGRTSLGGKAMGYACPSPDGPIFLGERPDRDSVPDWMRLIL